MIGTGLCGAGLCNVIMGFAPVAGIMPLIWAFNGLFHSMLWAPIIRTFTDLLKNAGLDSPFEEVCLRTVCETATNWLEKFDLTGLV